MLRLPEEPRHLLLCYTKMETTVDNARLNFFVSVMRSLRATVNAKTFALHLYVYVLAIACIPLIMFPIAYVRQQEVHRSIIKPLAANALNASFDTVQLYV